MARRAWCPDANYVPVTTAWTSSATPSLHTTRKTPDLSSGSSPLSVGGWNRRISHHGQGGVRRERRLPPCFRSISRMMIGVISMNVHRNPLVCTRWNIASRKLKELLLRYADKFPPLFDSVLVGADVKYELYLVKLGRTKIEIWICHVVEILKRSGLCSVFCLIYFTRM